VRVLIVGGSGFLGGAVTDTAAALGHDLTVASRGLTARAHPPGVKHLALDRYGAVSALTGLTFDLVVDTCVYTPDGVTRLLAAVC
jgi:2'-hydroxyisoflavone reductase